LSVAAKVKGRRVEMFEDEARQKVGKYIGSARTDILCLRES
jgi:hypothetical protein